MIHDPDDADDGDKVDDGGVNCNILEEEKPLNCKLYPGQKGISM